MRFLILLITDLVCLIVSTIWWISSPGWEPAIMTTGSFGGLLLLILTNENLKEKFGHSILSKGNKTLKSGDNSENYQGEFIIINRGLTYEETKSIAMDVFNEREKELTERLLKKFSQVNSQSEKNTSDDKPKNN